MLTGAFSLGHGSLKTAQDAVLLAADGHGEGLLGTADEEGTGTAGGAEEGWVGLLAHLAKTAVEHGAYEVVYVVGANILLVVLLAVGRGIVLHIEMGHDDGLLLVLLDVDYHALVVGHGVVDALGRVDGLGNLREECLDFLFYLVDVDVAHDDDGLQVGAIPLVVVVAQVLVGEVVDDIHGADGQAVFVL